MLFPISQVNLDFTKTNKMLYAFPKTGKSTIASLMYDAQGRPPLFIATEEGHSSLQVSKAKVGTWDGFLACLDFLEQNRERLLNEHSCVIVDLVSDLDQWCSTWLAARRNIEYVG